MSLIKNVKTKESIVNVEFPELEGFVVRLTYLGRDKLQKIRNKSLVYAFNKRTHQKEETIDNDKFIEMYAEEAIKGWSGLKVKYLPKLLPVDISSLPAEDEVPYSEEEALELIKSSTVFDQFITDTMNDYERFSVEKKDSDVKNSKSTSVTTSNQVE